MLRLRSTTITLTQQDVQQASERIAARQKGSGKAKVRRGPERSRDEAITPMGRVPSLQPPMSAEHVRAGFEDLNISERDPSKRRPAPTPRSHYFYPSESTGSGSNSDKSEGGPSFTSHRQFSTESGITLNYIRNGSGATLFEIPQLHLDLQFENPNPSLLAPLTMNHQQLGLPRSPLYQSHTMSSPSFLDSASSPQQRQIHTRHQLSDSSIVYAHFGSEKPETLLYSCRSSNILPIFSRPLSNSQSGEDNFNNGAELETRSPGRTSSRDSSSATEAAMDNLPSPLDHIGQQAAAYRSRVSSANRTSNRGRVAEIMRRIDRVDSRHSSDPASSSPPDMHAPVMSFIGPSLRGASTSDAISPRPMSQLRARDGALSSLDPEGLPLPSIRHRRTLPQGIQMPESAEVEPFDMNRNRLSYASSSRRLTPTQQTRLGSPVLRGSSSTFTGLPSSSSPQRPRNQVSVNMVREDMSAGMSTRQPIESSTSSIRMPRTRPTSSPRGLDPYERNNDFLARIAAAERMNTEIGHLQRPTPPPAVGHGRPASEEQSLPRNRSRPLPRWQYNQENSEEAAMSGLQNEMRTMHLRNENDNEDREVMDDTPPREGRVERYLRE